MEETEQEVDGEELSLESQHEVKYLMDWEDGPVLCMILIVLIDCVHLSVVEVHWRIIANLGFKFRSKFTAHCGRGEG